MAGSKETDVCEAAVAKAEVTRGGTTYNGGRWEMAVSMRATWPTGAVNCGAEEGGASAVEGRLERTGAEEAMRVGDDPNSVFVGGKEDEAAGEWCKD